MRVPASPHPPRCSNVRSISAQGGIRTARQPNRGAMEPGRPDRELLTLRVHDLPMPRGSSMPSTVPATNEGDTRAKRTLGYKI